MYLAYSALQQAPKHNDDESADQHEKHLRYKAYKIVCERYREEIAAIQKYFPDWKPRFDN